MFIYLEPHALFFHEVSRELIDTLSSYGNEVDLHSRVALESLILAFEEGLRGKLPQAFYLSSIDPGVGKTQAISTFLKVWKSRGFLPEGSVLVGVKTKDEIQSLVDRLGLDDADYACLTTDKAINALGRGEGSSGSARVLITTQQMIVSRTKDRSFSAARDFHFEGAPRTLRIWDESLVLAEPVVLPWTRLSALLDPLKQRFSSFTKLLHAFLLELHDGDVGRAVAVPRALGEQAKLILAADTKLPPFIASTLNRLKAVAGRSMMLVSDSGQHDRALVGSGKPLPADFAPAIITDASGRVRGTYDIWEQAGGLVRLPAKANDYRNLRLHLWTRAVGKDFLRDEWESRTIYQQVTAAMEAKPSEPWLVISFLPTEELDVPRALRETLKPGVEFEYLWWGRHHGTNAFKHIKNVVVIGSNFYPANDYDALAIAATGTDADRVAFEALPNLKPSEFKHNFLQAIMRGNARNSRDGVAGECDVYIVASKSPAPDVLLRNAFPGSQVELWGPPDVGLSNQERELVEYVTRHFADSSAKPLKKSVARKALGIPHPQRLTALLRMHRVKWALSRIGVHVAAQEFRRS
jgi:hypothetical protein